MRRPTRDRLEYLLYATIMTSTTIALGLGVIFATDEHGNRRKPIMNQPLEESLREARMEFSHYQMYKQRQVEGWMIDHGYEDWYRKLCHAFRWESKPMVGSKSTTPPQQQQPPQQPSFLEADPDQGGGGNHSGGTNHR